MPAIATDHRKETMKKLIASAAFLATVIFRSRLPPTMAIKNPHSADEFTPLFLVIGRTPGLARLGPSVDRFRQLDPKQPVLHVGDIHSGSMPSVLA
jgi:hypothetical protein